MADHPDEVAPQTGSRDIAIDWQLPADVQPRYVTNLIVQHTADEFFVYLFVLQPPLIMGTPEEQFHMVENLTSIPAKLAGAFVLTPPRMAEFIEVMQANWERHQSQFNKREEAADDSSDDHPV